MVVLGHVFWSQWKGDKGLSNTKNLFGLICLDSDYVASTKDPQFFRRLQILCGSYSATPRPTFPISPFITEIFSVLRNQKIRISHVGLHLKSIISGVANSVMG